MSLVNAEHLYTFVLEFRGGTYIAQVIADSPVDAFPRWVETHTDDELMEWDVTRTQLLSLIGDEEIVTLSNVQNVWCVCGNIDDSFVLLNIIETTPSA